jgi:hypothetical protein
MTKEQQFGTTLFFLLPLLYVVISFCADAFSFGSTPRWAKPGAFLASAIIWIAVLALVGWCAICMGLALAHWWDVWFAEVPR